MARRTRWPRWFLTGRHCQHKLERFPLLLRWLCRSNPSVARSRVLINVDINSGRQKIPRAITKHMSRISSVHAIIVTTRICPTGAPTRAWLAWCKLIGAQKHILCCDRTHVQRRWHSTTRNHGCSFTFSAMFALPSKTKTLYLCVGPPLSGLCLRLGIVKMGKHFRVFLSKSVKSFQYQWVAHMSFVCGI